MPARFLLAHFATAQHRIAVDWLRPAEEAIWEESGAVRHLPPREFVPAEPVVTWRLVSDNRREIARGCRMFTSEDGAWGEIEVLLRSADQLQVHASPSPRLRSTRWFATSSGTLQMMGARAYEKRTSAASAGALAVRLLRELSGSGRIDPPVEAAGSLLAP